MTADVLRRAADAMDAEADRLDTLDSRVATGPWLSYGGYIAAEVGHHTCGAGDAPWGHEPGCGLEEVGGGFGTTPEGEAPDVDLIVHRRNTLARDAATLRAMAAWLEDEIHVFGETDVHPSGALLNVALSFLGEPTARAEHTLTTHAWTDDGPRPGPGFVHRASS